MAPNSDGLPPDADDTSLTTDGRSRRVPEPYLQNDILDRLARSNVELLSELWIARDRLAVLERLLVDKGILGADEVDRFHPDEAFSKHIEVLREQIVRNVIGAPLKNEVSVAELKATAQRAAQTKIR